MNRDRECSRDDISITDKDSRRDDPGISAFSPLPGKFPLGNEPQTRSSLVHIHFHRVAAYPAAHP